MKKVFVAGAGTMGSGIAQAFAQHDTYEAILCDQTDDIVQSALNRIEGRLLKAQDKGKMEASQVSGILSRIRAGGLEDAKDAALVVEAVVEQIEVKRKLFSSLHEICNAETLFTTNTSSLSITEIARGLGRPVTGMHFFNPAERMELVEVTSGLSSPPETTARIKEIAGSIGKIPVEVTEGPGFVVNRMLIPLINEGIGILADGIASAEDIDIAMKLGANHPMGPLALGDLIGLDVCLAIMEILHRETGDDKYRPHPLLRKMVRGGFLGQKTGRGFFKYPARQQSVNLN
jgi:3-hydroxybutyryl-CoA dehydrogenase